MKPIRDEKDLVDALKNGQSTIEIEGSLAKKTVRIKATGGVAWAIAAAAISIAVYAAIAMIPITAGTGGTAAAPMAAIAAPASVVVGGSAVAILGAGAAATAIAIGIRAKGMGPLKDLRNKYDIVESTNNKLILKRKS